MRGATRLASGRQALKSFQSTPLMRGATALLDGETITREFQSTPLMRGATFGTRHVILFQQVSIHAPHARGDQSARTSTWPRTCFNPRPSCEGRRARSWCSSSGWEFQSTPLMRGATRDRKQQGAQGHVSIHAPHARGDQMVTLLSTTAICFNPRPSCEGRLIPKTIADQIIKFQSTPLMRGATRVTSPPAGTDGFQSTPLMRGATDGRLVEPHALVVSIHAPHARGDARAARYRPPTRRFNPRPSCEGRLLRFWLANACNHVSIHAPHARGDLVPEHAALVGRVSIHAPHARGDAILAEMSEKHIMFQSTPLMRGATGK